MPYVKPTSDIFIKYLLGTEEHKDLLLSFINAVMENSDFPLIKSVEIKNPFNLKKMVNDKESILDIKATDENGKIFNIEMQTTSDETFKTRSLYYWARLYSSQLDKGDKYKKLFPVISINILEFEMFSQFEKYHSTFVLMDKQLSDFILTDHLAIHFLELPKVRNFFKQKGHRIEKELEKWLYYLNKEGKIEEDKFMEILLKEDNIFRKAHEKYVEFTQDEEMLEAYESHIKWLIDYNSRVSSAREEGIMIGKEEGLQKGDLIGKIELIQQILQKPISDKKQLLENSLDELQTMFKTLEKEWMSA
ncbi:MAG: PD-(D/E)XK nuclease family transposase [Desulfamplus sp.]|nr:PD-(D/E)XK nuclease family transposase [Desulfamplus sp.]